MPAHFPTPSAGRVVDTAKGFRWRFDLQDGGVCGTHKCNLQTQKCSFPCAAPTDCMAGFTCMAGVCQPIVLAANQAYPFGLGVDATPLVGRDLEKSLIIGTFERDPPG